MNLKLTCKGIKIAMFAINFKVKKKNAMWEGTNKIQSTSLVNEGKKINSDFYISISAPIFKLI